MRIPYFLLSARSLALATAMTLGAAATAEAQTAYALLEGNQMKAFSAATFADITPAAPITGLKAGETVVGIDSRPATGQLYGLGYNPATDSASLYLINPTNNVATQMGSSIVLNLGTGRTVVDFNPTVDRIRVIGRNGTNYRLHPVTGALVATDGNLAYAAGDANAGSPPRISAGAYTNNYFGGSATVLLNIDDSLNVLTLQDPPNAGVQNTIAAITGLTAGTITAFDIASTGFGMDMAFVATYDGTNVGFGMLNLASGQVTFSATPSPGPRFVDMAVMIMPRQVPPLTGRLVYGLTPANALLTWDSDLPGTIRSVIPVTGLAPGYDIRDMDVRPSTGELYALAYNTTNLLSQIYTINPGTGVATAIGTPINIALGTNVGFDFNPTVDRIRVVSSSRDNYRLNPITGGIAATDTALAYAAGDPNEVALPLVGTAAYTNSYAGATTTAMYVFDHSTNVLALQSPPNRGTLNTIGAPDTNFRATNGGVDIDIVSTDRANGNLAYAIGSGESIPSRMYDVNLTTGAFTNPRLIGLGVVIKAFSIAIDTSSVTSLARRVAPGYSVVIAPNPVSASSALYVTLPTPATLSVEVFDASGRLVSSVPARRYQEGGVRIPLALHDQPTGIYQVRVTENGRTVAALRALR